MTSKRFEDLMKVETICVANGKQILLTLRLTVKVHNKNIWKYNLLFVLHWMHVIIFLEGNLTKKCDDA